ncbi:MAG: hypothetical protein Q9170_007432 [Blastenia crenularia]
MFMCCRENGKVLIKSSIELERDVPLFLHLAESKDVSELYGFLLMKSNIEVRRQMLAVDDLDKLVERFE